MATSKTHWIKVAEVYDYGDDLYDLVLKTVPGVSLDIAWQSMTTEQRRGVVEESIALVEIVLTLLKQSPISMSMCAGKFHLNTGMRLFYGSIRRNPTSPNSPMQYYALTIS